MAHPTSDQLRSLRELEAREQLHLLQGQLNTLEVENDELNTLRPGRATYINRSGIFFLGNKEPILSYKQDLLVLKRTEVQDAKVVLATIDAEKNL